ncbi:hypothetical protein NQ317_003841 [Molorchus minor]|uniref:Uncharacterized protein n=1 Tax=Molorchus minor TaxID=1323400 RepID=A0ABQ9IZU2_9CUCU|nr:hypothetical protein NQ317_003841 [Molorchus minor]
MTKYVFLNWEISICAAHSRHFHSTFLSGVLLLWRESSLTVSCANASASYFKVTAYRFDHLDETLKCVTCALGSLDQGTFDISGNQIKVLDIRNSSVVRVAHKAFVGLIFMEKLLLSHNPISYMEPGAFVGIRKVRYLELENAVSHLQPSVFADLRLLETLILKGSRIASLDEGDFYGLSNLKTLDLSFNKLSNVNRTFEPLVALQSLQLQNNQIARIYGNEFDNLNMLLLLNLENNLLANFSINLGPDNHLRVLNLAKNKLASDSMKIGTFQNLPNLEELDLSYNKFSTIPPKMFQGLFRLRLPHLRTLNLSHNALEIAEVSGRLLLHSLHTLDLSDNHIQKINYISFIVHMPRISAVYLLHNNLPCETALEVETLFKEDGIRFLISSNHEPSYNCKPSKLTAEEIITKLGNQKMKEFQDRRGSLTVWIMLTTVMIVLVLALVYIQFCILTRTRSASYSIRIS